MKTRKAAKVIKEILNKIDKEIEEKAKRAYPDELRKHYFEETLDLFREAYVKGYKEGFKVGLNKIEDWFEENNDEIISDGHGGFTTTKELKSEQCITNCGIVTQNIINHETESDYVDLGLPSGTLWADRNVGADKPEEDGCYYWCHEAQDLDRTLPTIEQIKELIDCCSHVWTKQNDVGGFLFTGPNGNSIFMPAAGSYFEGYYYDKGRLGFYWSHTLCTVFPIRAYHLVFDSDGGYGVNLGNACYLKFTELRKRPQNTKNE